jgi:hypothetical protein
MIVAVSATVDDCLSCRLRGVFGALRAVQRDTDLDIVPELVVVAAIEEAGDTLLFNRLLASERLNGRIVPLSPRDARKLFDDNPIPGMYLIDRGQIAEEWLPPADRGTVAIDRLDVVEAVARLVSQRKGVVASDPS